MEPYELMLQLMAKRDDPFSGGRTYYCHPSLRRDRHAAHPAPEQCNGHAGHSHHRDRLGPVVQGTGRYTRMNCAGEAPVVVCSLGDASITEGEVAEAFQMAVLKKLPIIYLVQDNEWDISASADEIRVGDASDYAKGFKGLEVRQVDGIGLHRLPRPAERCDRHGAQGTPPFPRACQGAAAEPPHQRRAHGVLPHARRTSPSTASAIPSHASCSNCSIIGSNSMA